MTYDLKAELVRAVRELTHHRARVDINGPDTDAQIQRAIQEYISDGRVPWVARFRRVRSWWYRL